MKVKINLILTISLLFLIPNLFNSSAYGYFFEPGDYIPGVGYNPAAATIIPPSPVDTTTTTTPPPPFTGPIEDESSTFAEGSTPAEHAYSGTEEIPNFDVVESNLNTGINDVLREHSDIPNIPLDFTVSTTDTAGVYSVTMDAPFVDSENSVNSVNIDAVGVINGYSADFKINDDGGVVFQKHEIVVPITMEAAVSEVDGLTVDAEVKELLGEKTATVNVEADTVDSSVVIRGANAILEIDNDDYVYRYLETAPTASATGEMREVKKFGSTLVEGMYGLAPTASGGGLNGEGSGEITFNLGVENLPPEAQTEAQNFDLSNKTYALDADGYLVEKQVTEEGTVFDLGTLAIAGDDTTLISAGVVDNIQNNLKSNAVVASFISDYFDYFQDSLQITINENSDNFNPATLGLGGVADESGIPSGLVSADNVVVTLKFEGAILEQYEQYLIVKANELAEAYIQEHADLTEAQKEEVKSHFMNQQSIGSYEGEYKYVFAGDGSNDLLFTHQPRYEVVNGETVRGENYTWVSGITENGCIEHSIAVKGNGEIIAQTGTQEIRQVAEGVFQQKDVGSYVVSYYVTDEDSGQCTKVKVETYTEADFIDEIGNDGIVDTRVFSRHTVFEQPVSNAFDSLVKETAVVNRREVLGLGVGCRNYTEEEYLEVDDEGKLVYRRASRKWDQTPTTIDVTDDVTFLNGQEVSDLYQVRYEKDEEGWKSVGAVNGVAKDLQLEYDGTGENKIVNASSPGSSTGRYGSLGSLLGGGGTSTSGGEQKQAGGETATPGQQTVSAVNNFGEEYIGKSPERRVEALDGRGVIDAIAEDSGRAVEDVKNAILDVLNDPERAKEAAQLKHVAGTMILSSRGIEKEDAATLLGMLGDKDSAIAFLVENLGFSAKDADALYIKLTSLSMEDMLMAGMSLWHTDLSMDEVSEILAAENEEERDALLLEYLQSHGLSEEDAEEKLQEVLSEISRLNADLTSDILSEYGFNEVEIDYINNMDEVDILVAELGISELAAKLILAYDKDEYGDLGGMQFSKFLDPILSLLPEGMSSEIGDEVIAGLYSGRLTLDNAEEFIGDLVDSLPPPVSEEVPQSDEVVSDVDNAVTSTVQ